MRWLFVAPERGDVRRKASGIESHRDRGGRESADAGRQVVPEPTRHQRRHLRTPLCGLADLHWAISAPHWFKGVTEHFRYTRLHDVFALLVPVELP